MYAIQRIIEAGALINSELRLDRFLDSEVTLSLYCGGYLENGHGLVGGWLVADQPQLADLDG